MMDLAGKLDLLARSQVGKPYVFGAEVDLKDPDPKAFDCSEFIQWVFNQAGFVVPDGSQNQYAASIPVTPGHEAVGDVGFFKKGDKPVHHVGLLCSHGEVIDARGEPHNAVIVRPRAKWDAWKEFTGWRRFPQLVKEAA